MKKNAAIIMILMFVLSISSIAFAANPFDDVPEKHWAYEAVNKLAQAGVITGYDDNTFRGDKTITRYEMAQMVAKAISQTDKGKGNVETKALVDKLSAEFATELDKLGVAVKILNKKVDRVQTHGELRYMWRTQSNQIGTVYSPYLPGGSATWKDATIYGEYSGGDGRPGSGTWMQQQIRFRLNTDVQLSDTWKMYSQYETQDNMRDQPETPTITGKVMDGTPSLTYVFARGPIAKGVDLSIGKLQFTQGYGFLTDDSIQGVGLKFGNKVKANLQYGRMVTPSSQFQGFQKPGTDILVSNIYLNLAKGGVADNSKIVATSADFTYKSSKSTTLRAGYFGVDGTELEGSPKNKTWEASAYHQLDNKWSILSWYAHSMSAPNRNNGYLFSVFLNAMPNLKKPGSYGAWLQYRYFDEYVGWNPNLNLTKMGNPYRAAIGAPASDLYDGTKGYEAGYYFVPTTSTMVKLWYTSVEAIHHSNWKQVQTRAQVEFFF